jgi:hypothetical protein
MSVEPTSRPAAKVTPVGDQDGNVRRLRIQWPPGGTTNMVSHEGEFTVRFKSDGIIRREIEMPDGQIKVEEEHVVQGQEYSRPAGVRQRVINLSDHPLDADKDEKRPGRNSNPDDTERKDAPGKS